MIKLEDLIVPEQTTLDPGSLVAEANFRPRAWQSISATPVNGVGWSKDPVQDSEDLRRIIALPRRERPDPEGDTAKALIELMTQRYRREVQVCRCTELRPGVDDPCILRLRLAQSWALYEAGIQNGLLAPIGVGHGKTILNILAPLAMKSKLAVLLCPPGLVEQVITEYNLLSQHFRVPSIVTHGRLNFACTKPNEPVLHVFPYSLLSQAGSTDFLERLNPDLIEADEVDCLRHADAVRTARVLRFFHGHQETRFCGWSGSITDASIKEYAHLASLALREGSPLPIDPHVVDDWSRAIDAVEFPAPAGALFELCREGEHVQSAFHRRLVETPGVVATTEPSVHVELVIEERAAPPIPQKIEDHLNVLRATWCRPDGEELVEAIAVARCAWQLACGFYYRWTFPRGESVAQILEWMEARKWWRKELRAKLKERRPFMDSPLLCARAAARAWGDLAVPCEGPDVNWDEYPVWQAECWPRWKAARGTVQPETEAVLEDPFLAEDAAAWAQSHKGVVWYQHAAFGAWVSKIAKLPMFGGGPEALQRLRQERGNRSIICSISAHGRGRDGLQFLYSDQLVANPSSSGSRWEQLLGRLHRAGQKAPTVHANFYRHTPELEIHVDTALRRALYVENTLGTTQKLRVGFLNR